MTKKTNPPAIGRVVQSLAGRDMGKFFVIVSLITPDYARVADGKYHKLNKPKKKKLKHLFVMQEILSPISEKLIKGSKVFDSEISSALKGFYNEQ